MPLYTFIGHDGPEGPARRKENRDAHVAHVAGLDGEGRVVLAGPLKSPTGDESIGAVIVFEAADLEAARAVMEQDAYVRGNVYASWSVSPFTKVFPRATE